MTRPRTRVLHVIQNLNYGGMERVLADLVRGVDVQRFEPHVLCLGYLGRYSEGLDAVATMHLASPMSSLSMLRPAALAAQIARIAPDVVHTHSGVWYKASLAARMAGVPWVVHTEHGRAKPDPLQHRVVDALAARRTDRVVAVSPLLEAELPRTLWIAPERVVHIPNGIDTGVYAPRADTGRLRRELGLDADAPIVGSIGRLEPIKGYDVMIEAFALLRRMPGHERTTLVVGGEGSARSALQARVAELGLADVVHLLGWRDDVHDLQSAFTLFTMSSRSEGMSISLLEAMSAGLAPVVTEVGGNAAVLGPSLGADGLVPSEAPGALAERWAAVLADGTRRHRLAALARARVVEAFGVAAMVRGYERLYEARPVAAASPVAVRAVRGVPPSPRSSAECPPTM